MPGTVFRCKIQPMSYFLERDTQQDRYCSAQEDRLCSSRCSGHTCLPKSRPQFKRSMARATHVYQDSRCGQGKKAWDDRVYHSRCSTFGQTSSQDHSRRYKMHTADIHSLHHQHSHIYQPAQQLHTELRDEELAVTALLQVQLKQHLQLQLSRLQTHHEELIAFHLHQHKCNHHEELPDHVSP